MGMIEMKMRVDEIADRRIRDGTTDLTSSREASGVMCESTKRTSSSLTTTMALLPMLTEPVPVAW